MGHRHFALKQDGKRSGVGAADLRYLPAIPDPLADAGDALTAVEILVFEVVDVSRHSVLPLLQR